MAPIEPLAPRNNNQGDPVPAVANPSLLLYALIAIVALVLLIARYRINPFIVLTLVSLGLALVAGMPAKDIMAAYETGVGKTLGHIALVVALGTMLGKMMAESGGADRIALTLIDRFGERNAHWAMVCIAFVCGLPLFFEVGFVLLIPIAFTVARRTGVSMLMVGLPMVAGLSVVHGLVPPHPAAMMAVGAYGAEVGKTVAYAILVGVPTAIIAGPLFAKFIAPRIVLPSHNPMADQFTDRDTGARSLPGFGITMFTVLLPVGLMLLGGWAPVLAPAGSTLNGFLLFIGNSVIALLIATVVSFWTLGLARGFSREDVVKFSQECLAPTAGITLLLGALMRVATGSATVAMTTSAGIVAPIALAVHYPHPELLVLATGAGSLILSHVNDGGFWLIKEYFNMSVVQTLKTWTVLETLISVVAFGLVWALAGVL